jgi:hypothetical protein
MDPATSNSDNSPGSVGRSWFGPALAGMLLVAVVALGGFALLRGDPWGDTGNGLSERFSIDTEDYQHVEQSLIGYSEVRSFPVDLRKVRGVAVSPEGEFYVAGDRQVVRYSATGEVLDEMELDGEPTCLAVAGELFVSPGQLFVGIDDRVLVYGEDGKKVATWNEGLDEQTVLTSIALAERDVFLADAGNRVVLHLDADGRLLGRIGDPDPDRGIRGFVIPSPYFDVAATPDGLLCVANPGARRIETFTYEGDLLGHWGTASAAIEGFFGCCNPSHFAVFPDGRFVTSEKGIPRIKVCTAEGRLECVVADPDMLGQTVTKRQLEEDSNDTAVFDVAVLDETHVVVLDPANRRIRVFAAREP